MTESRSSAVGTRVGRVPAAADLLETIVAATRRTLEFRRQREPAAALERRAAAIEPRGALFRERISRSGTVNVIAECKRRSPSRGMLRPDYDPAAIAEGYEAAGAAAVSVLTEPTFFDGALEHLHAVRARTAVPVLRKDFIVDEYQLVESRAAGADAVLLIVAALLPRDLRTLLERTMALGLSALVEVHDLAELDVAVEAGAEIVGVNNRNLRSLEVTTDVAHALIDRVRESSIAVAESGLTSPADIEGLAAAGYDAFLIGERLMTRPDPGGDLRTLLAETRLPAADRATERPTS